MITLSNGIRISKNNLKKWGLGVERNNPSGNWKHWHLYSVFPPTRDSSMISADARTEHFYLGSRHSEKCIALCSWTEPNWLKGSKRPVLPFQWVTTFSLVYRVTKYLRWAARKLDLFYGKSLSFCSLCVRRRHCPLPNIIGMKETSSA